MEEKKETSPKPKKSLKGLGIGLAIIALCVGGYFLWNRFGGSSGSGVYVMPVEQVSSNASSGMVNRFSGVVEPQQTKDISLDSNKTISEIFVKEGDHVNAGDKLFSYNVGEMQLDLEQKNVEIQGLYAEISNTQSEINELYNQKASASSDQQLEYSIRIQTLQASIRQFQLDIQSKQLEIDEKRREIEQAVVTSPIDGIVKTVGDQSGYSESSAFITIVAEGNYIIKGKISELNMSDMMNGTEVVVRSRVDESKTWKGTVSAIDTGATANSNQENYYGAEQESASKYYFYVSLEDTEGLMMGQHVTVEPGVETGSYKGILLGSYYIVDVDGNPYVWVSQNNKLKKAYVELGKYNPDMDEYEVLSGLEKEDYIAYPDETLKEGMKTTTEYSENVEEDFYVEEMPSEEVVEEPIEESGDE